MAETSNAETRPTDPVGRVLFVLAQALMLAGGVLMSALAIMIVVSVTGRWLVSAPIPGDFEMVAMGTAVAVLLFFPYCHLRRGNVIVDLFLAWAPKPTQAVCDLLGDLLLGVIAGGLAWRMFLGGADMLNYGETTVTLGVPIWWAFPFGVAGFGLLAVCCLYTALRGLVALIR